MTPDYLQKFKVAVCAKVGPIHVQTQEELRAEREIVSVLSALGYRCKGWSLTRGTWEIESPDRADQRAANPMLAMGALTEEPGRVAYLFFDIIPTFAEPRTMRTAKDLYRTLTGSRFGRDDAKVAIFISAEDAPDALRAIGLTTIRWPMPDRTVYGSVLDSFLESAPSEVAESAANGNRDELLDAMSGLTTAQAANALARSQAERRAFVADIVRAEKAAIVNDIGLEYRKPNPRGLADVGGLDRAKGWLDVRRKGFSQAAREYGLPAPRGMLVLGVPGTGKSLMAQCVASAWRMPLLRMDIGAFFGKYVGETEERMRRALATAEAIAPCVLWIDEIEKALGGGGGGESDGGTATRAFGTFLTWMQERKPGVFIIATANDVSKLPPEFLRAGRWDDMFFVDLPNRSERVAIANVMRARYTQAAEVDAEAVARIANRHTGAEIEQAFVDALNAAFADGERAVTTEDVISAIGERIPLAETAKESVESLRAWARGKARMASEPEAADVGAGRAIETIE